MLITYTVADSFIISVILLQYDPELVFIAAALTAAMVIGLTIYAIYTKTDFTMMGGLFFMLLLVLIALSIMSIFF